MQTLRLFFDVARCHSFSQAAARHGITQSAASQRISHLEKKLRVTLIDRSVRPLALTEAGEMFLAGVTDVLERYDRLERKVAALKDDPEGLVRVAAIYSAGVELLNRAAKGFEAAHPRITLEISYEKPDEVYHRVLDNACELGILSYPQRWRKVGIVSLRDEVMVVVCHPRHDLARHARIEASQLTPYPMVTFDPRLPVGRRIRQYLKKNGASPEDAGAFDNIDTIKNAVLATYRFSILPAPTVLREIKTGALSTVELTPRLTRPIGVIFRKRHRNGGALLPAAQVFLDFLLETAGPDADGAETPQHELLAGAHI